jgi:hypothetical protein
MSDSDAQKLWDDYYTEIKVRRTTEANALWSEVESAGLAADDFTMDFTHFSSVREDAEALASQLSENYSVELVPADKGYWFVKGTTRPDAAQLSKQQHLDWVEFMVDVARSYACVFSAWSLESSSLQRKFSND